MRRETDSLELAGRRVNFRRSRLGVPAFVMIFVCGWMAARALRGDGPHDDSAWVFAVVNGTMGAAISALVLLWAVAFGFPRRVPGTLRVAADGLAWNGALRMPRRAIREAVAYTNGDLYGVCVRGAFPKGPAYFEVDSRAEAEALADALASGQDAPEQEATATFAGGVSDVARYAVIASGAVFVGTLSRLEGKALLVATAGLLVVFAVARLVRERWVVAAGGLRVEKAFRKATVVPYADLALVEVDGPRASVTLRDGSRLSLVAGDDGRRWSRPFVGAHALALRLEQTRDRFAARARAQVASPDTVRIEAQLRSHPVRAGV